MIFSGQTTSGDKIGRKIGFPTLNIILHNNSSLKEGVFVVRAQYESHQYLGVMHVGSRPTFGKEEKRIEIHLLDFEEDVQEKTHISGEILGKIRDIQHFQNQEELIQQIQKDTEEAQKYSLSKAE